MRLAGLLGVDGSREVASTEALSHNNKSVKLQQKQQKHTKQLEHAENKAFFCNKQQLIKRCQQLKEKKLQIQQQHREKLEKQLKLEALKLHAEQLERQALQKAAAADGASAASGDGGGGAAAAATRGGDGALISPVSGGGEGKWREKGLLWSLL